MSRKIYLSRHGQTLRNKISCLPEDRHKSIDTNRYLINELTEQGKEQARTLGCYLESQINNLEDVVFVTSSLPRSVTTAGTTAETMGTRLNSENHFPNRGLIEQVPIEHVPLEYRTSTDPLVQKWLKQFKPAQEIGEFVLNYLLSFNEQGKDVIAILHKSINTIFLKSLNIDVPPIYRFDNCGLYIFEVNDSKITSVEGYLPNYLLLEKLENSKAAKNHQIPFYHRI